jgi:rhamnose utilization protein RhaD (predicted bifunctional aldolase and dehydrogenase)
LKNLTEISKHVGMNLDLVQGAGGNTSVKDDEVLWVKASGCCLKDAGSRDIFVPVDYPKLIMDLARGESEPVVPEVLPINENSTLRPSIETSLHAIMPHRYVIHVHSVNAIANAVLAGGETKITQLLNGIDWAWVPYVRPGLPLTRAVQKVMRSEVNVLVLANHGLVVGAETMHEVIDLLDELETRLSRSRRELSVFKENELAFLLKNTDYKPSQYSIVHSLAFDPVALSIATTGSLYPDHIVFLGTGPMRVMADEVLRDYLAGEKQEPEHKVIIVKNFGVIIHPSLSESAEEMLHCLANVLLRIQSEETLRYLTEDEEAEIAGWDAEKFRQTSQK